MGTVMEISKLPAFRLIKRQRQLVLVGGLCAVFQAIGADANHAKYSSTMTPAYEDAEASMQQKYIKRLKPADPESTEYMLAGRGLEHPDPSNVLS